MSEVIGGGRQMVQMNSTPEDLLWYNRTAAKPVAYNGFSGVDMNAMKDGKKYYRIRAISMTAIREMAPIYTMGDKKRPGWDEPLDEASIYGTLVFEEIYIAERILDFEIEMVAFDSSKWINDNRQIGDDPQPYTAHMKINDVEMLDIEDKQYKTWEQYCWKGLIKKENLWHYE